MRHILLIGLLAAPLLCSAQAEDEKAVIAVIDRFFAAMTARDTAAMAKVIAPDGMLHATRAGKPAFAISHATYLRDLTKGSERLVERYWEPAVRVDGTVATVTTHYDFHIDGKLSHCGVDVFTLVKEPDGWRISGGVFSMEKEDCPPSPLGPLDHFKGEEPGMNVNER